MLSSSQSFVDEVFAQFGISEQSFTNPSLLREILHTEMFLGGFEPFVTQIQPYLERPTSFGPMIFSIRSGIINRHPAIVEFCHHALYYNLFIGAHQFSELVNRVLHHCFLLELVVQRMGNLNFMLQLQNHFNQLKEERGVRNTWHGEIHDVRKITGSLFQTAKMVTVDKKTIAQYIDFRSRTTLTQTDLVEKNRGLYLNIQEARTADLYQNFVDNATVAAVLSDSPINRISVVGDDTNSVVLQEFAEGWASLYQTWNLAFVLGNMPNLNLVIPKLLIPQVMNATPEEYLYKRGITLWVTTNIVLLNRIAGLTAPPISPQMRRVSELWGKVNLRYAGLFSSSTSGKSVQDYYPGALWRAYHWATSDSTQQSRSAAV